MTRPVRQSSIYETEPVDGVRGSGPFLNCIVEIETEFEAAALLNKLLGIERLMGRKRVRGRKPHARGPHRPRVIDLDLLFFDKEVISSRNLQVPHPRLHERRFVLVPMSELAPSLIHPIINRSISELLNALKAPGRVTLMRADQLRPEAARRAVLTR
jgi:2-amino-4-hydroxy-6-hydroxymethyldihydropteridine diphosphokinase